MLFREHVYREGTESIPNVDQYVKMWTQAEKKQDEKERWKEGWYTVKRVWICGVQVLNSFEVDQHGDSETPFGVSVNNTWLIGAAPLSICPCHMPTTALYMQSVPTQCRHWWRLRKAIIWGLFQFSQRQPLCMWCVWGGLEGGKSQCSMWWGHCPRRRREVRRGSAEIRVLWHSQALSRHKERVCSCLRRLSLTVEKGVQSVWCSNTGSLPKF